jgi:xanthine dehydrogenase accessory factor
VNASSATLFQTLADSARRREPVALGIITRVLGSSPQKIGAKALFFADHRIHGTLGGGCLEAEAQRLARLALRDGQPRQFELVLDHDFGWDDGLICGGKVHGLILPHAESIGGDFWAALTRRERPVTWGVRPDFTLSLTAPPAPADWLYTETIAPPFALWIAGAGHIAQAVAPLAAQLDFAVTVFDDRPEYATAGLFPAPIHLGVGDWSALLAAEFPPAPTFGLIVTRGHKHDALVLESWIRQPFEFLGMLGSTRKARIIREQFSRTGLATAEQLDRLACPVGLRLHSQTVMEIAVDILAQYVDERGKRRQLIQS